MVECFGMRHQPENPAGWIAHPGNVVQGPVGIERECAVGRFPVCQDISERHLMRVNKPADDRLIRIKFPLTVSYGKFHLSQPFCKNARRCRVDCQRDPVIPEISTVIERERHGPGCIIIAKTGQKPQIDKGLESVADPDYEVSLFDKFENPVPDVVFQPDRLNHPSAMIISPTETPAEHHDLKIIRAHCSVNQGIDMHTGRLGACKLKRVCGFIVTV